MKKMRDFKGMPVISLQEGERLGQVSEVIVDPTVGQAVALLLDKRTAGGENQVVATANVHNVGDAVITVPDRGSVVPLSRIPRFRELSQARKPIPGKAVITEKGSKLGRVADLQIDPQTFRIIGLELQGGLFGRSSTIPAEQIRSIGPDAVIIREEPAPPRPTPTLPARPPEDVTPQPVEPVPPPPLPTGESEPAVPPLSTVDEPPPRTETPPAEEGSAPEETPAPSEDTPEEGGQWQRWVRKRKS